MKTTSLADSYLSLVDALSAVHQISGLDLESVSERELLEQALNALIAYQDLENCSLFLVRNDQLVCAALAARTGELRVHPLVVRTEQIDDIRFSLDDAGVCVGYVHSFPKIGLQVKMLRALPRPTIGPPCRRSSDASSSASGFLRRADQQRLVDDPARGAPAGVRCLRALTDPLRDQKRDG